MARAMLTRMRIEILVNNNKNQLRHTHADTHNHTHTGYSEVIITIIRNYIIMKNKQTKNILSIEDKKTGTCKNSG